MKFSGSKHPPGTQQNRYDSLSRTCALDAQKMLRKVRAVIPKVMEDLLYIREYSKCADFEHICFFELQFTLD